MEISKIVEKAKVYVAAAVLACLNMALVVCANTTSCFVVHEPNTPKQLDRFRRFK